jgi:hypothetical protein
MLLTSQDLSRQWDVLDAFEGPAYERVNIIVTTTDGTERSAQTYALRPNPGESRPPQDSTAHPRRPLLPPPVGLVSSLVPGERTCQCRSE